MRENFRDVSDRKPKRFRADSVRNVSRRPRRVANSSSRIENERAAEIEPTIGFLLFPRRF